MTDRRCAHGVGAAILLIAFAIASNRAEARPVQLVRERVTADVFHYQIDIRVGESPNARVRIHRVVREIAPWLPRPTAHAAMLLHGDFSSFVTNFVPTLGEPASPAPGLAPYLAARGIDVWGVDRRWTLPDDSGDTSDFGDMGVDQELGDIRFALGFARATRTITDHDPGRIVLGGFSHGGELAYAYAAADGRHVKGLAILDIYYDIAPEDADLRARACQNSRDEFDALAAGFADASNGFFIDAAFLARTAPDELSPIAPPLTNREVVLTLAGQTYVLAAFTPLYHLIAPVLDENGAAVDFSETSEETVLDWFAGSPPHQSMREGAELDAIWCGTTPRPELARIHVPLFYLGAAGGFGDHGLFSTTRVSSTDVTTHVVRRFGDDRVAEDFGHGDLLFARDAPTLAWPPLAAFLSRPDLR